MLVPITRPKFEQLVPIIATGGQYKYYWGKVTDIIKRLLISVVSILLLYVIDQWTGRFYQPIFLLIGIITGLYWLWAPVLWASLRNYECRRYKYSGFWRGEVFDAFVTEEVVGKEQTVNKRGELMIVENRETRLNLEIGDETGFSTQLQVPLRRFHKAIRPGQIAEMIVMSTKPDLGRIAKITDVYLPDLDIWASDYPYLRRDEFIDLSRRLENISEIQKEKGKRKRSRQSPQPDEEW